MTDIGARWGLPDWLEPEAYPRPGDATIIRRWGWEFLRRRTDYREAWTLIEHRAESISNSLRTAVTDDYEAVRNRYGMGVLIDPSAYPSDWDLAQFLVFKTWGYGVGYRSEAACDRDEAAGFKAMMFDLNRPLGPQIEHAKRYLALLQNERPKSPKPRVDNWQTFLRVLDARECGATFDEIARVLWPGQNKTAQSARDTHNAALDVQLCAPFFL